MSKRILCIGAHPDDIEISMGGTVQKCLENGDQVTIAVISIPSQVNERKNEALKASKLLGSSLVLNEEGFGLQVEDIKQYKLVGYIDGLIKDISPDKVFVHNEQDPHVDHRLVTSATFSSMRNTNADLYTYATPSARGINVNKLSFNYYVDITKYIEQKKRAILLHATQGYKDSWVDKSLELNEFLGKSCGCKYAEGFKLIRKIR